MEEIESLKRKLEETQRAMEQIMAQVNKVSTETKDQSGDKSPESTISSTDRGMIESGDLSDTKGKSPEEPDNSGDEVVQNVPEGYCTKPNDRSNVVHEAFENNEQKIENIDGENFNIDPKRETEDHQKNNCSYNFASTKNVKSTKSSECNTDSNKKENIAERFNSCDLDDQSLDNNDFSRRDDGIQDHYETTNFVENGIYQDQFGYSYHYEDVDYDENDENNSDESDDELEEYAQSGTDQQEYYASNTNCTRNPVEDMYSHAEGKTEDIELYDQNIVGDEECSASDDGTHSKELEKDELSKQSTQEIQVQFISSYNTCVFS